MKRFDEYMKEQMANVEFKAEYDVLESEFAIIQAMIDVRKAQKLTQKDLSERTGIAQSDISKFENGNANPTLHMLRRLAGVDTNAHHDEKPLERYGEQYEAYDKVSAYFDDICDLSKSAHCQ